MPKEKYKLTVEPITCVHIGSGTQLTSMEYKLSLSPTGANLFVNYSTDSVLKRVGSDAQKFKEFEKISDSRDFKALAQFMHKNSTGDDINYLCHCTKEFVQNYNKNKDGDPIQNGMFVEQMYRPDNPAGRTVPVIPGSSLKGAIRTAYLNSLLDSSYNRYELQGKKDGPLQNALMGNDNAKNDPFRALQIGDCSFSGKGTQLVGLLKNIKAGRNGEIFEHNTSQIQAEVIKGYLMGLPKDVNLTGLSDCVLNSDLSRYDLPQKGVSKKVRIQDIVSSCNTFYYNEFKNEYAKFYKNAGGSECDAIAPLLKELKSVAEKPQNENEFILRVGRWSQVEFVTYGNDFRDPKTPKRKGVQMPYGKTRTVFNYDGLYLPLGWCKCTFTKDGE